MRGLNIRWSGSGDGLAALTNRCAGGAPSENGRSKLSQWVGMMIGGWLSSSIEQPRREIVDLIGKDGCYKRDVRFETKVQHPSPM